MKGRCGRLWTIADFVATIPASQSRRSRLAPVRHCRWLSARCIH